MNDRASRDELSSLLSTHPSDRVGLVILHLLLPCDICVGAPARLESPGSGTLAAEVTPEVEDAYEMAIDRVFARVLRHADLLRLQRSEARKALALLEEGGLEAVETIPRELKGLALFEALLARSWSLRHEDPGQMIEYAWLATRVAADLSAQQLGPERVADLQCLAWAELGNAHRVADNLDLAESAFAQAVRLYQSGTADRLLWVHLVDLQASLAADRRQFRLACRALSLVHEFHQHHGDLHLAGRALISKGLYTGYAGDPQEAIRLLRKGAALVDDLREPGLAFAAVHNQLWFLVDLGRYREARELFSGSRGCLERVHGGRINRIKVRWLEGRIDAGLDDAGPAEQALREVLQGLEEAGLGYQAALASLDLAGVLLSRGRTEEAEALVQEAGRAFAALRIEREGLGAILMLGKAFEIRMATAALVKNVASFLRRAEHDPDARFDPEPGA